ncbi:MAG: RAMP superfamily CRISPR-associated protein [Candidatus Oleimicrobiaceae bacterium]
MIYEYYADLAKQQACPTTGTLPQELAAGFVDGCTVWSTRGNNQKNEARQRYIQCVNQHALALPVNLHLKPNFNQAKDKWPSSWCAFEITFTLATPWYSKDDRVFHVLDNPVRKDRIFGVPFMAAASWKGMLRWACRVHAGLLNHLSNGHSVEEWDDPPWIAHLFGNEKGEAEHEDFRQGALVFYPTWFDRIGFEVINPHSRERRAGTQPIYYEVVPPEAQGTLTLLYAPLPGATARDGVRPAEVVEKLLEAIEQLLTTYGISAKRTVGWGTATIKNWKAYCKEENQPIEKESRSELWATLKNHLEKRTRP